MAVERLKPLNQHRQAIKIDALFRGELTLVFVSKHFEVFQTHKSRKDPPLTHDIGKGDVVSDPIRPSSQGAAGIVPLKTAPKLKMNVLAQVAASFRVSLVGAREPFE